MSVGTVSWWDGSRASQSTSLRDAFLSPVSRGTTTVASTTLTFPSEHGLNLDSESKSITSIGPIRATVVKINPVMLEVSIYVDQDLGEYNDDENHRIFYTGQQVPFTVSIPKTAGGTFTDKFYMTLGPVIAIHNTVAEGRFADGVTFGGYLKPETGKKIVLQSRAHEWYQNDSGNIVDTGNDGVGASAPNDRIRRGRQYVIVWSYNDTNLSETLPTSGCPNVDQSELLSGESVY